MATEVNQAPWLHLLLFIPMVFLLLQILTKKKTEKPTLNLPPGPRPLPIVGNFHLLSPLAHRSFSDLSKTYGPLMHLRLGRIPALVVSSSAAAREVLKTHDLTFCSRPSTASFRRLSYNSLDVATAPYNDHWRHLRKLYILQLFSSKKLLSFRPLRAEEVTKMLRSISSGAVINLSEVFMALTNSVTCRAAFGRSYSDDHNKRNRLHGAMEVAVEMATAFFAEDYFPGVGKVLDTVSGKRRRLAWSADELDKFYEEVVQDHLERMKNEKEWREEDLVDVLIAVKEQARLTMDHIKGALMNILIGGTDTSAATLIWAMAEMIKKPNVLRRAQEEIRRITGKKGKVEEDELPQFEYLKMVISETLRLHPPLTLIPRETMQHCRIAGYDVSTKTRVFVNAWQIGREEACWEKPEEFVPERFEGSSVDYRGHDFSFIPFGSGRRICPGMSNGIAIVELALANLLYAFDWALPNGEEEAVDMTEAPGIIVHKRIPLELVATKYILDV